MPFLCCRKGSLTMPLLQKGQSPNAFPLLQKGQSHNASAAEGGVSQSLCCQKGQSHDASAAEGETTMPLLYKHAGAITRQEQPGGCVRAG